MWHTHTCVLLSNACFTYLCMMYLWYYAQCKCPEYSRKVSNPINDKTKAKEIHNNSSFILDNVSTSISFTQRSHDSSIIHWDRHAQPGYCRFACETTEEAEQWMWEKHKEVGLQSLSVSVYMQHSFAMREIFFFIKTLRITLTFTFSVESILAFTNTWRTHQVFPLQLSSLISPTPPVPA